MYDITTLMNIYKSGFLRVCVCVCVYDYCNVCVCYHPVACCVWGRGGGGGSWGLHEALTFTAIVANVHFIIDGTARTLAMTSDLVGNKC